ncbi:FecR family protein [Acinetobacter larvae]|uniref:Histidine kinase n=1 Tax=Acinetobacter larvae TaxID=1789224 RepID=A0A1B2LZX9_9GAMM|nr:FecR domain-containing protein [Acinetobacter larvae]AOA58471.1 histidine kinase [Acinetobacter larvae]
MPNNSALPTQILEQAADWMVLLHAGDLSEQQYQQFLNWQAADPRHAQAIQYIEKMTAGLAQLPAHFQPEQLLEAKHSFHQIKKNIVFGLAGLCLLGGTLYLIPWDKWQADQYSAVGEIKRINLADGSQLILASNSYINIHFDQQQRQIELISGEIYIQTAKDPQHRPFVVRTDHGDVTALGTQFTVRQDDRAVQSQVHVYQHAVAIQPKQQPHSQRIGAGQYAQYDEHHVSTVRQLKNQQPYWTQQLLVVEHWPLDKVLTELYRYKKGTYLLDPRLAKIPVSGVFSLKDIEQSLEVLAYQENLSLNFYSPYLLRVQQK